MKQFTRRRVLALGLGAASAGLLAACAPIQAPSPTPAPAPKPAAAGTAPAGAGAAPAASPAAPAPVAPASKPIAPVAAPSPAVAASPAAGASPVAHASPAAKPAASAVNSAAKRGGTLSLLRTAELRSFNPTQLEPGSYPIMRAFYNALVRYDQNLNVVPELAESYTLAPDGKSITLKLRKGVKFHSGREVTAEDVAFTLDWYKDAKNTSPIRGMAALATQVETPDPGTVILRFNDPNPGVFDMLDLLFIIDKNGVDQLPQQPAGTGPFRLGEYRPNELTRMVPNPDYWEQGKPYIAQYDLRPAADAQAMTLQLEAGQADVIWVPTFPDLLRLSKDPGYHTSPGAPGAFFYDIAVNTSNPDLSDKRVRQAISYALDRERFARTALQGIVEATSLPVPKTSWAYFPELEGKHARNIDKAKQLMADAGKSAGFDVVLLTSSKRGAGMGELAQILQNDLQQIGIRARIEDVEVAVYEPRSRESQFDLMCHTYGRANKDPGTLFTGAIAWFPKGSWTKFESQAYADLIAEGGRLVDREQRKVVYKKLMEMVQDECFTIPVCEQPRAFVWRKRVQEFAVTLDNVPYVSDLWLDA